MPDQSLPPAPLSPEVMLSTSGLEIFRRMAAGELPPPPVAVTMNFAVTEADEGRVVFAGTPTDAYVNPLGRLCCS